MTAILMLLDIESAVWLCGDGKATEQIGRCLRVFGCSAWSKAAFAWGNVMGCSWGAANSLECALERVIFKWRRYHEETWVLLKE